MKTTTLKKSLMAASLLAAAGFIGTASAHTQTGSLGTTATATDYYQVTCGTGTTKLYLRVSDTSASDSVLVSAQAQKGTVAINTTDPTGGDGVYSPSVTLSSSTGVYDVLVDKTAANTQNYTLEVHCQDNAGVEKSTTVVSKQNQ